MIKSILFVDVGRFALASGMFLYPSNVSLVGGCFGFAQPFGFALLS